MGTPRLVAPLFPIETPRLVATLFLIAMLRPIATQCSMGNAVPNRNAEPDRYAVSAASNSSDNTQRNCLR